MDASVFPLMMGHDVAQVSIPLPIPRALRSDTAATEMYSSTYSSVYVWAGGLFREIMHAFRGRQAASKQVKSGGLGLARRGGWAWRQAGREGQACVAYVLAG